MSLIFGHENIKNRDLQVVAYDAPMMSWEFLNESVYHSGCDTVVNLFCDGLTWPDLMAFPLIIWCYFLHNM